jgi:hypothetical protein
LYFFTRGVDVVVPTDRDCRDVRDWTDDHLGSGKQLARKMTVSYDHARYSLRFRG